MNAGAQRATEGAHRQCAMTAHLAIARVHGKYQEKQLQVIEYTHG